MTSTRTIAILEGEYFASVSALHVVDVLTDERDREHLYFRDARRGQQARSQDLSDPDGPGIAHIREAEMPHVEDVDAFTARIAAARAPGVPVHRHASFAAYLDHVGYDWRANRYRKAA